MTEARAKSIRYARDTALAACDSLLLALHGGDPFAEHEISSAIEDFTDALNALVEDRAAVA